MAYTNISNIITGQALNLSGDFNNLTTPLGAVNQVRQEAQNTGDIWFVGGILLIFLFLTWLFYRNDKNFLIDFTRSILISSGWCFFISTAFLLSGWIKTAFPLIWFATLILISIMGIIRLKSRNL